MELRHLRYFVAVAERLNFRQAAEHLHLSQPALSTQIRDLEHELGVALLERNPRGVCLTAAGATLLEEARGLLAHAQRAVIASREAARGRRGQLVLGNLGPLSDAFMSPAVARFRDRFPDVDVTLLDLAMADHVPALEARRIQIGFNMGVCPPLPPSLRETTILRCGVHALLGRAHPRSHRSRLALADLAGEPVLCLSHQRKMTRHGDQMRALFSARGLEMGPVKYADGFNALVALLASGREITLMPDVVAVPANHDVISRPLADRGADLQMRLRAIWRRDEPSIVVANFLATLQRPRGAVEAAERTGAPKS